MVPLSLDKSNTKSLRSVWLEKRKSEKMEYYGRMEKCIKYLVFPLVCLVGGVEKWEGGKLFYLV